MNESKFYRITNNSNSYPKFTWAFGIVESPQQIEPICPGCSRVNMDWVGSFSLELEGGKEFPDMLGCGEYPMLIVSERVVDVWEQEKVSGYSIVSLSVATINSKHLKNRQPPKYFRIIVDGSCKIDFGKSFSTFEFCSSCERPISLIPFDLMGYFMVSESWSGADIFRDEVNLPAVDFCTEKLLDIARKYQFTNFRFEKMTDPYEFRGGGVEL